MKSRLPSLACLVTAVSLPANLLAADQVLVDQSYDFSKLILAGVKAAPIAPARGFVLSVATGHEQTWPGVTLPAPGGAWDLSAFGQVVVRAKNTGTNRFTLYCRVDNPGADGVKNCLSGSLALGPGETGTLRVDLKRAGDDTLGGKLFGLRGYPVGPGSKERGLDPARINQLVLFVSRPKEDQQFELADIRASGVYTPPTASVTDAAPFFPLIDTFGQYKHRDWPGKVHSQVELQQRRTQEAEELTAKAGPGDWDRYGGWGTGPQLKATGFFRTEKHSGKWWLVDPEGRLFYSHGVTCVRMLDVTAIEERETWFEDFPGTKLEFAEFFSRHSALKGHYANRSPQCFSFAAANLKRKYGPDWKPACAETAHLRLRSWGMNTIANWSDSGVYLLRRTPYTDTVSSGRTRMIEGSEGYWGKFPDVFDPGFAEGLRRSLAGRKNSSANDPWCIGYFSDNEMSWGDETSLAIGALKSPSDQAAKQAFLADLRTKYREISKLNATWGTAHASWEALLASREGPDKRKAREDLVAFYGRMAETYFRTVKNAIKEAAPNQLYLGCRFAWVNDVAARAAAGYCDVVSYNLYQRSVANFKYPGGDKPLIIGEFHFGALDRGMFHTGLVPVANQAARAEAYKDYLRGALRHPQFVGTHWFQWKDEPTTGRVYDEENYQIGLLDIADTPYRETIEALREVGYHLYQP
jgi:hypothetical protein